MVTGSRLHNGARVRLRKRSVSYFTDVYVLSALCSPLPVGARIILRAALSRASRNSGGEHVATRVNTSTTLAFGNRVCAICCLLLNVIGLLPTIVETRYGRATFTEYIRDSQIRFPFRWADSKRGGQPRNVNDYFQHSR